MDCALQRKVTCEEQVKLRKQNRRETARATTKGQGGARKSLWLENLIDNELDNRVGAEEG